MEAFSKLTTRLARKARRSYLQQLYLTGQSMIQQLRTDLAREAPIWTPAVSDFVIVSIDFEGDIQKKGINDFGIATLDSREILQSTNPALPDTETRNFAAQRF